MSFIICLFCVCGGDQMTFPFWSLNHHLFTSISWLLPGQELLSTGTGPECPLPSARLFWMNKWMNGLSRTLLLFLLGGERGCSLIGPSHIDRVMLGWLTSCSVLLPPRPCSWGEAQPWAWASSDLSQSQLYSLSYPAWPLADTWPSEGIGTLPGSCRGQKGVCVCVPDIATGQPRSVAEAMDRGERWYPLRRSWRAS